MRLQILFVLLACATMCASAQNKIASKVIDSQSVAAIENVLASDAMRGRAVFTPDIERAADYIEKQFRDAGLKTWNGSDSYRQPFSMIRSRVTSLTGTLGTTPLTEKNTVIFTSAGHLKWDEMNGDYKTRILKAGEDLRTVFRGILDDKHNHLVLVDSSQARTFARLNRVAGQHFRSDFSNVFVLSDDPGASNQNFSLVADLEIQELPLANVVGILPGKGADKDQYVIFSGHYDHLGVREPDARGDSIYNGANDDASGTTAVILLARYFSKLHENKRTLVFAAFTAEEIGEYGSQYFSSQFDPDKVVAMFNIEMIGLPSKWGENAAFITGFERSSMSTILQKNLTGSKFAFHPDPYPTQNLFYRSDNASLARQGVPAHTISTTQIDIDKTYHTPEDEVSRLDMKNMAEIIKAIALSSTSIVDGKDTPTRVDKSQVR